MRLFRAFVVLACLAVFALAGCGLNPSGNGTGTTLRVANLIPGSTSVTVTAGDSAFMSGAPFETITSYADIPAGTYTFNVNIAGTTTPAFSSVNTLFNVSAYTFLTYGQTTTVGGLMLADTLLQNVPTGNFALRLANVSPTAGVLDVYLTAPGADLSAVSPIVTAVAYQSNSAFINTAQGTYQLRLTRSGTKEVVFDAPAPAFADGSGQTVVAYSRGSGRLVNVVLLTSSGAATIIDNRVAQIKAVNASSVASPLNVFVDSGLTLANVPYTGVSNYQSVAAGARTITVEAAATPGATLLTTTPTLKAATDTSIALYGAAGSLGALVLTDANVSTHHRSRAGALRQRLAGPPGARRLCQPGAGCIGCAAEFGVGVRVAGRGRRRHGVPVRFRPCGNHDARSHAAGGHADAGRHLHHLRDGPGERAARHCRPGLLTAAPGRRAVTSRERPGSPRPASRRSARPRGARRRLR